MSPRNRVLDGIQITHWKGHFWMDICQPSITACHRRMCLPRACGERMHLPPSMVQDGFLPNYFEHLFIVNVKVCERGAAKVICR